MQDLALGLVEPHTIDLGPSIQPVQVPLQSLPALQQINTPAQLGVICKLTEGALDPFIQIIDKDIKQDWPQHRALGNTTCDRPPTGVNSIHHHSLGPAIQYLASKRRIFLADGTRQEEVEGELSEEERWFGNSSETPSEASYGEVQENFKLSLEDRIQEQSTSPDTSLGSATPSSNTAELGSIENEALRDALQSKEHLSPDVSSLCEEEPPGPNKPLSSNLRRLLEAGSLKLDAAVTVNGRDESPVNLGSNLSFSPPAHHAQQLSVLARKLAEKQEQSDQYNASSHFIWNQAILKLKAAANAVLQDKSLSRTEDTIRFESFSSPFSSQSASSTLAALSKKVSERSMTPGQEHPPPASSFLSLASMTSSAALLKEVAARAAGTLLAEKKKSLVAEDPLQLSEMKQEKATPPQSLELLLLPVPKGRASKPTSTASEEEGGKPFQCPICGLVIKRKSYWKRHMVIHTGLKSHQCPLCPFRCARKDNLKSHMKVHQHQDRGETFQCQLCPFTSSRHFSLKLHMRCHQHFLRTESKVKEEIPETEVKGSPQLNSDSCPGPQREGGGPDLTGSASASLSKTPDVAGQPSGGIPALLVKEEPKDDNGISAAPFALSTVDRAPNNTKLKDSSDFVANTASALFSQDISVKMASDFLMKLSGEVYDGGKRGNAANQKEPLTPKFKVKEEPKDEEAPSSALSQSSYVFSQESEASAPNIPEEKLKPQEAQANVMRQDMSVKAASELLMKLSGIVTKEFKQTPHPSLYCYSLMMFRQSNPPAMSMDIFNYIRSLRAPSNLTLNVSKDEAFTTNRGNLFQWFTTLIVKKKVFLISSLNLASFSLKQLTLVLSQQVLLKILKGHNTVSTEPSLLWAEQPQLSQPFSIGEVFHPSDHSCGPPLDLLQQVHVFPVLRTPELDAVLQVGSHQSRVEGQNHLPQPAGHASFDAAQDMVGLLGCEHTLLAHVQLFIHQYPQVLFCRAALNPFIPHPVQDLALGLVEPHEVHMGPLLQLVQVPLDGILSLRHVNHTTQLSVVCKLAEGALDPAVYVIDEDIKQYQSQYGLLRDTPRH
ncbi:hypothetical protein QYF61_024137 [Mycteria americana]|uniref:C2H2-type domain-containing protein n=1 Tax=Mycteria americana TaxID=33587 RepID=A0AAN7NW36_MYCAM|nr:hypothetical protein QYF61_024137 [Mycteria americana]